MFTKSALPTFCPCCDYPYSIPFISPHIFNFFAFLDNFTPSTNIQYFLRLCEIKEPQM